MTGENDTPPPALAASVFSGLSTDNVSLYASPSSHFEESPGRSTLTPKQPALDLDSNGMRSRQHPKLVQFASVNTPPRNFSYLHGRPQPEFHASVHENDEHDDRVYMINSGPGSFSANLDNADDPLPIQATIAIAELENAQNLAVKLPPIFENASFHNRSPAARIKLYKNIINRSVFKNIKFQLGLGATLILERVNDTTLSTDCCTYSLCPNPDQVIPLGSYYLVLDVLSHSVVQRYCLLCLERIWSGHGMQDPLPNPSIEVKVKPVTVPASSAPQVIGLDGVTDYEGSIKMTYSARATPPHDTNTLVGSAASTPATNISATEFEDISPSLQIQKSISGHSSPDEQGDAKDSDASPVVMAGTRRSPKRELTNPLRKSTRIRIQLENTPATAKTQRVGPDDSLPTATETSAQSRTKRASKLQAALEAEKKLKIMYEQRKTVLESLGFGERAVVKLPRGKPHNPPKMVSRDAFGIVHTDLFADCPKYRQQAGSIAVETPREVLQRATQPAASTFNADRNDVVDHWCICHGVDDGSVMLQCCNEKCLIGWYHLACVGTEVIPDGDWQCQLCEEDPLSRTKTLPALNQDYIDYILAPSYAGLPAYPDVFLDQGTSRRGSSQLDGTDEGLGFEDLWQSKHAPARPTFKQTETEEPQEPECPPSSADSTGSDDEWQMPPIRFQHLAQFIKPGQTLDEQEKASLRMWRLVSQEQLQWAAHWTKTQQIRPVLAGLVKGNGNEHSGPVVEECNLVDAEEEPELAKVSGLSRNDCRSIGLRGVLLSLQLGKE